MVRSLMNEICATGLDVPAEDVDFEVQVPEVRGRLDALFGHTVFEFKRDLRRELSDAEEQLGRYIPDRERATGNRYLGIATDGAEFVAYEVRQGQLSRLEDFSPSATDPRELLTWLDTAITVRSDLMPDPLVIRAEFGRESLVFRRSLQLLREAWEAAREVPEAVLKRELWGQHLEFVYGTLIDPDELFLQHTYLTIVAKTMAVRALVEHHVPPSELLQGTPFTATGLNGAVEADFFDWVLLADQGADLVERVARQVERFRLAEIEVDVLKGIYESLIDPAQRHYLGEYYTPDWLADWVCNEAVPDPLSTRVLDPSCGSGTFLFHSIRRYIEAAEASGSSLREALVGCTEHVMGIDVHPVAVLFSRVTYLLAIGPRRLRQRNFDLSVPVYLGDALQWDVRQLFAEEEIEIVVPGGPPLRFPGAVAGDPGLLDKVLRKMRELADGGAAVRVFANWIASETKLPEADREIMEESYGLMRSLHEAGRNHIWTYIVRNLTRPLWLSLRNGRPDALVGNPPWLRYNAMSEQLQERLREACRLRGLWSGGRYATHQDLSAYFFARTVERYLDRDGRVAFVMPMACLSRAQFRGFRTGRFGPPKGQLAAIVKFDRIWTFGSDVQPLFNVPSCVLFGHRDVVPGNLPASVTAFSGALPQKDATPEQARLNLSHTDEPAPWARRKTRGSRYRSMFKQGATIMPRRLMLVEPVIGGKLGVDADAPLVTSRESAQDKKPWKELKPLRGQIEKEFLRPLLLGENIAPFRRINSATAVIPFDARNDILLDRRRAIEAGHTHLARWLKQAERYWNDNSSGSMTLAEQLDYYGKLGVQFPIAPLRVVYAKAGTKPAAAIIEDGEAVIDHKLYWMIPSSREEAQYLCAVLNSEAVRSRIEHLQSEGMFGPRDFDKVMFSLPIPRFKRTDRLHQGIAAAGLKAERVAALIEVEDGQRFQAVRKAVRDALVESGETAKNEALVERLLQAGDVDFGRPAA